MSAKTATGRKAGSVVRGPRALERLLIVGAVVAVLVSVGAWIAMNRPGGGAEAAGAGSSATAPGDRSEDPTGTDAGTDPGTAPEAGTDTDTGTVTDSGNGTGSGGQAASTASSPSSAGSAAPASGRPDGAGRTGAPSAPTPSATAPLSPTKSFLTALAASGLAPPVDDTQTLAMADDVCQEMGYGSTYTDVVRALTFAGATDAEAANFARLAITHICPRYETG